MRTVVPADLPIPWINMGKPAPEISIADAIKEYSGQSGGRVAYVGKMALRNHVGQWTTYPYSVFWQEKPKPDHTHYFGLLVHYDRLLISNAISVTDHDWIGAMHPKTGEIIFSRHRYDYRLTEDGSIMQDGGPGSFTRGFGDAVPVLLRVIGDRMCIVRIGPPPVDEDLASQDAT